MSEYAVIVQNDESDWDDIKGELYHYPNRYRNILTEGCKIIYFKGQIRNKSFAPYRLTSKPHYFGCGIIGKSIEDPESQKKDWYCEIIKYNEFQYPVLYKIENEYLEEVLESKKNNYWRFGVREISETIYKKILSKANLRDYFVILPKDTEELESYDFLDGERKVRFSSYYERNQFYRNKAIKIHGLTCMVCGFNFEKFYGEIGKGYINVHHNKPISKSGPTKINPEMDMSVLCSNCHAMLHRNKCITLKIDQLKKMITL